MAFNRCFDTFIPNASASDYMNTTRQKTIFNEVSNNIRRLNTANPLKKNHFRYNNNFGVRPANAGENAKACLTAAKNYALLLDITKGQTIITNQSMYCNNPCHTKKPSKSEMGAPVYDAWSGNLYSVNYTNNTQNNVVNPAVVFTAPLLVTEPSFSIVDPSHALFYEACPLSDNTGYPPSWFDVVDISFNNTTYFKEANTSQLLNGFAYPEKVYFCQG